METHIRHRRDPPPIVPGRTHRYAALLDRRDPDVRRLRDEVQEEGKGLYILRMDENVKSLVEAYYPDEISAAYAKRWLSPPQLHDMGMGRLVVIAELGSYTGEIPDRIILNLRKNNRDARRDRKRKLSALDIEQQKRDLKRHTEEKEMQRLEDSGMIDRYVEAAEDTRKYATGTPRVAVPDNLEG